MHFLPFASEFQKEVISCLQNISGPPIPPHNDTKQTSTSEIECGFCFVSSSEVRNSLPICLKEICLLFVEFHTHILLMGVVIYQDTTLRWSEGKNSLQYVQIRATGLVLVSVCLVK